MRFDGSKLRSLRKARNWDQHALAELARRERTGVNAATVSRHENNHHQPTSATAAVYAKVLGVDVRDLMSDDDDDEESSLSTEIETLEEALLLRLLEKRLAGRAVAQ